MGGRMNPQVTHLMKEFFSKALGGTGGRPGLDPEEFPLLTEVLLLFRFKSKPRQKIIVHQTGEYTTIIHLY